MEESSILFNLLQSALTMRPPLPAQGELRRGCGGEAPPLDPDPLLERFDHGLTTDPLQRGDPKGDGVREPGKWFDYGSTRGA